MVTIVRLTVPLTLPISFHLPDSPGQKCKAHPGQSTLLAGCSAPVPVPSPPHRAPQQICTLCGIQHIVLSYAVLLLSEGVFKFPTGKILIIFTILFF